jgi:hypothetical protein
MKTLITAAAATYALVLMVGGCSSKTAVPTASTQALNSAASSSSSKLSPQAQATINFPKASCGDKSTAANDTWYPVFVDGGDLNTIRHQFCADAVATVRKDTKTKTPSVQLASFTNRDRASEFANTVGGDVGQPTSPDSAQAVLGCGVVNDPTGTPLNVRRSPNGEILGAFSNGQQVMVKETVEVNDKKWLHVVAPSNDGYVFANYITGCDSPTPSADNEPQNNEASVEPVTSIDEVYAPTTVSSSGGSCNSPDDLDSRGHRCGGRASGVRASSTRTFSTRTSGGRGRR